MTQTGASSERDPRGHTEMARPAEHADAVGLSWEQQGSAQTE